MIVGGDVSNSTHEQDRRFVDVWLTTDPRRWIDDGCLSESERRRSERFRNPEHRRRYRASHVFLRQVLSRYVEMSPERLEMSVTSTGKPKLGVPSGGPTPGFNLSHSDDVTAIAVASGVEVGIDVEHVSPVKDLDRLVATCLSDREMDTYYGMTVEDRFPAFYRGWTRKEAILKGLGVGISDEMARVDVGIDAGSGSRWVNFPKVWGNCSDWELADLVVVPGCVGAVAYPRGWTLRIRDFENDAEPDNRI